MHMGDGNSPEPQPDDSRLCYRCWKHRNSPRHWCIRLVRNGGRCACWCGGR